MDAAKLTALEKEELGASFFLMLNVMKMINGMNCQEKKWIWKAVNCGTVAVQESLLSSPTFFLQTGETCVVPPSVSEGTWRALFLTPMREHLYNTVYQDHPFPVSCNHWHHFKMLVMCTSSLSYLVLPSTSTASAGHIASQCSHMLKNYCIKRD